MWVSPEPTVRLYRPVDGLDMSYRNIAAFDMDSTLITPKNPDKTFADGREDWAWWHQSVPSKLRELHENKYQIVIFSNQSGVSKGSRDIDELTGKVGDIAAALGIPIIAMMSLEHDRFRKPSTGMYGLAPLRRAS